MLTLGLLSIAGILTGRYFHLVLLVALSFVVAVAWTVSLRLTDRTLLVDVLMLFAYLTAVQGGYLLGSHLRPAR